MDEQKKILVVEDDKNISMIIKFNIEAEGWICDTAFDGPTGLEKAKKGEYDLLLLDVMLPGMNGFDICREVRKVSEVPIIMCTAREEEKDKVLGLDIGADDYITKPFSNRELISRIRAHMRRSAAAFSKNSAAASVNVIRELEIDTDSMTVRKRGTALELSRLEYDFISYLAKSPDVPRSREEILENVWGYNGFFGDVRTVDVTMSRMREKVEDNPAKPEYLMTKRGYGYYIAG